MANQNKLSSSFRDPSGFVYQKDEVIYRQVNTCYRQDYELLMNSGLYVKLTESKLLISHEEVENAFLLSNEPESNSDKETCLEQFYKCLKPEQIPFISYPYEWSFSQLKDAALLTLSIQKLALEHEMSLKDASAYNIQFVDGKPIFIDSLSFEKYREGHPWIAYKQFCEHFLAPLALMAYRDLRTSELMQTNLEGVELDLAVSLLPKKTVLNAALLMHLHLHASSMKKHSKSTTSQAVPKGKVSKIGILGIVDNLESAIKGLSLGKKETFWKDYYQEHNYSSAAFKEKKEFVSSCIRKLEPSSVIDLGANTGEFSRLAQGKGIFTVSADMDPLTIEASYLKCKADEEKHILPLRINLMAPSPAIGWGNKERMSFSERCSFDLSLALALVHHLAITNNVPLPYIAEYFSSISNYLVIEFVPKADSQVKEMLSLREDIFDNYNEEGFEAAFERFYTIEEKLKIGDSERTVYLMKRN